MPICIRTIPSVTCVKKARLLLTRIPKVLAPFLLFAVIGILIPAVRRVYVNPLTAEMSRHLSDMEDHTDHSSAEYAKHLEKTQQVAKELLIISIAVALVTLTLAFAKQIVAYCFAAFSTTSSGDRYSLADLLREMTKWQNLKPALVTTAAMVTVSQLLSVALLGANLIAFLALLYLGVLAVMSIGITRKERSLVVLVTLLLPALLIPLCEVALLYLYAKEIMGLGLRLLSVHDLLQGVQDLLY